MAEPGMLGCCDRNQEKGEILMNEYAPQDEDIARLKALYDDLLCHENDYLGRLRDGALKAREGLDTGIILHAKHADDQTAEIEVRIPKYAITVIGARTGGGKTATMVNLSTRLAMAGKTGMYVTLEEPAFAINARMMSCHSARSRSQYSSEWMNYVDCLSVLSGNREYAGLGAYRKDVLRHCRVIDANGEVGENIEKPSVLYYPQHIAELIEYRNLRSESPLDFVMIDFGQLLESIEGYENSNQRIRAVMQALKNLAGTGLSIIIGAQMKRECYGLKIWDWEPELLRDGSDMEQAANLIIFVGKDKDSGRMALRYGKNRNGPQRVAGLFDIDFAHSNIPNKGSDPDEP